ncbi:MAG: hypothetical protein B7X37_01410 [Halothiobacillus sp. 14-55-98]|jgi:hypothetical protein|nr:MAG: hypothetical protein B7X37_01410 [Halothiobacillus sp. 14-55-98]
MLLKPDLRDFQRMPQRAPMRYQNEHDPTWQSAELMDLSASGLAMFTTESLPEGSVLNVEIAPALAVVPPLRAVVEVRRCEPDGEGHLVGVRFVEMY